MTNLTILAGAAAYRHIKQNGLSAPDISTVFGASGAAKWLTIYGLDRAIFSEWFTKSSHAVDLFGTSVGAFKLAAAAQQNPAAALTNLADAYIAQDYRGKVTAEQVGVETEKILNAYLDDQAVGEILNNPRFNYHCSSIYCKGWLASGSLSKQKAAMFKAFALSVFSKHAQHTLFDRCIFHGGSAVNDYQGADGFHTHRVALSTENFRQAVQSSGSIPVVMPAVVDIPGAPPGVYRDGGLLDYHAVPSSISHIENGLVLYPHFYSYLKEGWFDKFWPWRKVKASQLDKTIIVAPSDEFVASLPGGRIPDRQDFFRFKDNDQERIRRWTLVKQRSIELGEEFLQLTESGDIAAHVTLLQ